MVTKSTLVIGCLDASLALTNITWLLLDCILRGRSGEAPKEDEKKPSPKGKATPKAKVRTTCKSLTWLSHIGVFYDGHALVCFGREIRKLSVPTNTLFESGDTFD